MPASISCIGLSRSTPDGRPLLNVISLQFGPHRTGIVGRNGVGKSTLLDLIEGTAMPDAGSVVVSGRIRRLRQLVQVVPGDTVADLFGVRDAIAVLDRATKGTASPEDLETADWTLPSRLEAALGRMRLEALPDTPLAELSGGQRTRAALAALLFEAPDILLLDEPTNNLDAEGRQAVIDLLAGWGGAALVVSHDRALLETMDAIVELTSLGAASYGGNYSAYRARKAVELDAAEHDLASAERRVSQAARQAQEARERQARRDAGGRRNGAKGDQPRILLGALKRRAEETGGSGARLAQRQGAEAQGALDGARERVEVLAPFSVRLAPSGLPAGRTVLEARELSGGWDAARPLIRDFNLTMTGPERVAIDGPNGAGKTTLLALLTGGLAPMAGRVRLGGRVAMLDQSVSLLDPTDTIVGNFRRLNPQSTDHACREALAAFKFRADAALQVVGTLSGGETLRAGLAVVLGGAEVPELLVLDEPTNHLDLESIEVVEAGLRAYDGALLVVSHDGAFLDAIGVSRRVQLRPQGSRASRSVSSS